MNQNVKPENQGADSNKQESKPQVFDGHPMMKHIQQVFLGSRDEDGTVSMSIPFNSNFIGNTVEQSMHLGPITAVLDSAAGASVIKACGELASFVTLDLRVDQLNPAREGPDIIVECAPYAKKGDLYFVKGLAWQGDENYPVLTFYSVFMAAPKKTSFEPDPVEIPPLKAKIEKETEIIHEMEFNKEKHRIFEVVPYANDLEMEVGRNEKGERIIKLPFADRHVGNPIIKALQGGIFLGFLECAGSTYLLDLYPSLKQSVSASVFMEYLKSPKPQDTFARVSASKVGRRVVNIDIEAFQLGRGVVAKASGRYLVLE